MPGCYDFADADLQILRIHPRESLEIEVTNNLWNRVLQHREGTGSVFTSRYRVTRLVYFEEFQYVGNAIAREKELKDWNRAWKLALI